MSDRRKPFPSSPICSPNFQSKLSLCILTGSMSYLISFAMLLCSQTRVKQPIFSLPSALLPTRPPTPTPLARIQPHHLVEPLWPEEQVEEPPVALRGLEAAANLKDLHPRLQVDHYECSTGPSSLVLNSSILQTVFFDAYSSFPKSQSELGEGIDCKSL